MKKRFLMILSAIMISTSLFAWDPISFTTRIEDDTRPIGNGQPKSPDQPPVVYFEDYVLLFEVGHPDYVLQLVDENNVVVFSSVIPSGTTMFQLPTTLEGEYQIQLIQGNILYWGIIILDSK
jgi:hypothetical protein